MIDFRFNIGIYILYACECVCVLWIGRCISGYYRYNCESLTWKLFCLATYNGTSRGWAEDLWGLATIGSLGRR